MSAGGGNGFAWFLARRYLMSSGGRLLSFVTWIALGGVIVGVTALVVVIGVMTGMQEELRGKILDVSPHVLLLEQGADLRMEDWREVVAEVRQVEGVEAVAPFVLTQIGILRGNYQQAADLYGVTLDADATPATQIERDLRDGVYDLGERESGLPPMVVGQLLAARMSLFTGDTITVAALEGGDIDPFTGLPAVRIRQFEMTGTFKTDMYDYDIKNVYTRLEDAQDLVNIARSDKVSGLGVRTNDPERATETARRIRDRVGLAYHAQSWTVTNQQLFSALKLEKLAMTLILSLIVIVAAFNIVGSLVMVVVDRTREIGILKSMGMRDRGVLKVFMLQGLWIGVIGTGVGTALGMVIAVLIDRYELIRIPPDVYFVDRLPVSVYASDIAMIVAISITVAFLATIYPALRASRLQPVDAIRHE